MIRSFILDLNRQINSQNDVFFNKNGDFVENILRKKVDFFSCDFDIFYGSIGCATKFHDDEISFFLSISI